MQAEEYHERGWMCPTALKDAEGEWIKLDDRTCRMLVRTGRMEIERLAKELGFDYAAL